MDQRMVEFIAALRSSGVRISLAESADAFQAVEAMGAMDREIFRTSLRATLIKEQHDQALFEKLFPLFFQVNQPPPMQNGAGQLTAKEAHMLAQALRQMNQALRQMMEKLVNGEPLNSQELRTLDQMMGSDQYTDLRYQRYLARQMEKALNFQEVKDALKELAETLNKMGMDSQHLKDLMKAMQANHEALQEQIRQHSGEAILRNLVEQQPPTPQNGLLNRPFQAYSENDMAQIRKEVSRLAAALRTRLALRLRRSRTGQLDFKSTLRANLKHGFVPIELRRRNHTLKPKLVVVCDISTSMRYCSELMLSLLHAIQDQISKTSAFTFIDHLEYVSPYFEHNLPQRAIEEVLRRMPGGYYNTDLGFSLFCFSEKFMDMVDHRTTFIVVGDGRNNYNDPGLAVLKNISRRARATIWLNPEPVMMWGTGDSDMGRYAEVVDHTFQVSNLNQLAAAIDQLLVH